MCELQVYSALHLSAAEQTTAAVETASTTALTEEPSDIRVRSSAEFDFPLGMEVHSETFTGTVYLNPIIRQDNPDGLSATNRVTFAPGVHNSGWHTHGAMMVIGTAGIGYYQEEGLPAQIIRPGDVIEIPEGVKHWHGAAPDSWFSQIVIWDAAYMVPGGTDEPPVTEEQYKTAVAEAHLSISFRSLERICKRGGADDESVIDQRKSPSKRMFLYGTLRGGVCLERGRCRNRIILDWQ